jgi:hypothetical protein
LGGREEAKIHKIHNFVKKMEVDIKNGKFAFNESATEC